MEEEDEDDAMAEAAHIDRLREGGEEDVGSYKVSAELVPRTCNSAIPLRLFDINSVLRPNLSCSVSSWSSSP